MSNYTTPGVYVEEISKIPASVAPVATAIPIFIGYTEKAEKNGISLIGQPTRIKSLLEYQELFGGNASPSTINVSLDQDNFVLGVEPEGPRFYLFDSLRLFYANGGGPCYIMSVALYSDGEIDLDDLLDKGNVFKTVKKEDEPTLVVIPDAMGLDNDNRASLQQAMLSHCAQTQDRFALLDLPDGDDNVEAFRNKLGMQYLDYGAAYYPQLRTGFKLQASYAAIDIYKDPSSSNPQKSNLIDLAPGNKYIAEADFAREDLETLKKVRNSTWNSTLTSSTGTTIKTIPGWFQHHSSKDPFTKTDLKKMGTVMVHMATQIFNLKHGSSTQKVNNELLSDDIDSLIASGKELNSVLEKLATYCKGFDSPTSGTSTTFNDIFTSADFSAESYGLGSVAPDAAIYENETTDSKKAAKAKPYFNNLFEHVRSIFEVIFERAKGVMALQEEELYRNVPVYHRIIDHIEKQGTLLPPSGAIAGIYASVDRERGVWQAPANRSLAQVIAPSLKIDNEDQGLLNVDAVGGKSINAIRQFNGKGNLVWGARTLAGNSNEWRYVNVRRLFIFVEESVKKASEFVVFEPNTANTWVKLKGMINNFLYGIWRDGGLAGAKPEQAYMVKIGLHETMTTDDILNGKLIVEVGMAAVRPAEFIVLRFMHKLQES